MSEADTEISRVNSGSIGTIGGGGGDEDDINRQGGGSHHKKKRQQRRSGYECRGGGYFITIVSKLLRKDKRHTLHRTKSDDKCIDTSSTNASVSCSSGKRNIINGSCFCFKQPTSMELSVESRISDPNDPNFTSERLKTLIERNDFYSRECNPHLHTPYPSSSNEC